MFGVILARTPPLRGMRRGTRTLRRPVLDRFASVPLVCAPERLRLSVHGRILQINALLKLKFLSLVKREMHTLYAEGVHWFN